MPDRQPARRGPWSRGLSTQAALILLAAALVAGCSSRPDPGPFRTKATYTLPDDFRLALMRFERRLEAEDIDGVLRSFDPLRFAHYRDMERRYLSFARRATEIDFRWRVSDIIDDGEVRRLKVPWTMVYTDALSGHRVKDDGLSIFHLSADAVPRLVGISEDPIF